MKITEFLIFLTLVVPITALADKTVYVGEGRFVGKDTKSVDSAVLRQRNQEQTERRQDRDRSEQRYQESERRERSYEREAPDRLY